MAPWDQAYVAKKWPNTPYDVGPLTEIQDSLGLSPVQGDTSGNAIELGGVPPDGSTSPAVAARNGSAASPAGAAKNG